MLIIKSYRDLLTTLVLKLKCFEHKKRKHRFQNMFQSLPVPLLISSLLIVMLFVYNRFHLNVFTTLLTEGLSGEARNR